MKLLLCIKCTDIRKLHYYKVECECKESWGYYLEDGLKAIYGGKALIIGLDNYILQEAYRKHIKDPNTNVARLDAWIMASNAENITNYETLP